MKTKKEVPVIRIHKSIVSVIKTMKPLRAGLFIKALCDENEAKNIRDLGDLEAIKALRSVTEFYDGR